MARAYSRALSIVYGAMEASLTPLMIDLEARFEGIKVFSLPSVDTIRCTAATSSWASRAGASASMRPTPPCWAGSPGPGARTGPEMVRSNAPE